MARVRYVATGDDVPAFHVFGTLANAPEILDGFRALGGRLLRRGTLDPRIRELVINAIAVKLGCVYEWSHHADMAREAGVSDEELHALSAGDHRALAQLERLCIAFAHGVEDRSVIDEDVEALRTAGLTDEQIVELTILSGFYGMTARFLLALNVELDDGKQGFDQPPHSRTWTRSSKNARAKPGPDPRDGSDS